MATIKILAIENMFPYFLAHAYYGQMAGWIRIPLGTEVGLGPGDSVLDGDPAPPSRKGEQQPPTLRPTALARIPHNPYCRLGSVRRADLRVSWQSYQIIDTRLVMVALWNRTDHYIFALWFFLLLSFFFFSSPNLSRRRFDVCHNSTHDVALVRI